MPDTSGELVSDLILRAVAAMRERGVLPDFEQPRFTITRLASDNQLTYRSNAGAAIAAAQTGGRHTPADLARAIADYLTEVVDVVPAYRHIRAVTAATDGAITVTISPAGDE